MTTDTKNKTSGEKPSEPTRKERLSSALRDNLRRRKAEKKQRRQEED